jgi:hypothetical protein
MGDRGYADGRPAVVDAARGIRVMRPMGFRSRHALERRDDLDVTVPALFRPYVLEFAWNSDLLRYLDLPAESMSVAALEWQLVLPWWSDGAREFAVRPVDVLDRRDSYPEHVLRTMAADLASPIDVTLRNERWFILDGVYRLLKARMLGAPTVRVRKVPAAELERLAV